MERRRVFGLVATGVIGSAGILQASPRQEEQDCSQSHIKWVADAMLRMQTIKPGMTREKLLTVFKGEGGISNRLWRTYVSNDCPYFKVDFEFEAVGDSDQAEKGTWLIEGSDDKIVKISGPYLQFSIMD
jgi:hypothetical protein